ncbi:MAG TPA: GNAT family N-acetyltransferase [Ferruginibacter sp.]|nr:GNAT family N-acetyltransferase [Ferruginibacter sp.]
MFRIRDAQVTDIPSIRALAEAIWPVAYGDILSMDQLRYMLDRIYSDAALTEQMHDGHRFFLALQDSHIIGFASVGLQPPDPVNAPERVYKLHKLYVSTEQQGAGAGRKLLEHIIQLIQADGATLLELNVNRYNKAFFFYQKLGFSIYKEVDIDIGNGYFMNDYVMRKRV